MAFVGKMAYLVLFPGILFILLAGLLAEVVSTGMGTALAGGERRGAAAHVAWLSAAFDQEAIATGGALGAVIWLAPVVKAVALAWVSCIIFGFFSGDLVLLFALLLVAGGADLFAALLSANPLAVQEAWAEAASLLAWAVPFALVLAAVALRSGEVSVSGLIKWQAANGVLLASSSGGATAQAGGALALVATISAAVALARLRPLGRSYTSGSPGGMLDDVSGPPLAMFAGSEAAALFVVPLVIVTLFFAGPSASWYQVLFWALKVLGVIILLLLIDLLSARCDSRTVIRWGVGAAGLIALLGLVLTWIGVSG